MNARLSDSDAAPDCMTLIVTDEYEHGDPGAPLGSRVTLMRGDTELVELWFGNHDNEEVQNLLIETIETKYGIKAKYTTTADNDYGYR